MSNPPVPAGVIIWTSADRFDSMATFYRDTLGLIPATSRPEHIAFQHRDFRLTIGVHDEISGPSKDSLRVMLNLAVDDIGASFERLRNLGVSVIRPPETESWGGWVATLSDPDGNTVQLLQLPPESD